MNTSYKRLPGRQHLSLGTAQSLWMGPDHLLLVTRVFFSESYSRFYYRDIQSIVIARNGRWEKWGLLSALLSLATFAAAVMSSEGARLAWSIPCFMAVLFLVIHLFRGPTCTTTLRSPVQTQELPSLRRLRAAVKSADLLRRAIEGAQGRVPPESLAELQEAPHETGPAPPSRETMSGPARRDTGIVHAILFSFLLANGILLALDLRNHHPGYAWAGFVIVSGILVSAIGAIIRQRGTDIDRKLVHTAWGAVAFCGIEFLLDYIVLMHFSFLQGARGKIVFDEWEYVRYAASLSPQDSPLLFASTLFGLAVSFLLGAFGFLLLSRHWMKR